MKCHNCEENVASVLWCSKHNLMLCKLCYKKHGECMGQRKQDPYGSQRRIIGGI